jgi:hypothetical protein
MPHVVLLLESNVYDCLRDRFTNSVKEFGLPDNDLQIGGKVYLVIYVFADLNPFENTIFEELDSFVGIFCLPLYKNLLLVVFIKLLS